MHKDSFDIYADSQINSYLRPVRSESMRLITATLNIKLATIVNTPAIPRNTTASTFDITLNNLL